MRENPIGVFDSGIGGLNVLKECRRIMPKEKFIYLKDGANMPYGSKSAADIRRAAEYCADVLFGMNCKAVVVACNTATAIAVDDIRRLYPSRIVIGLEPAVKPCIKELGVNGYAVALVTKATGESEKLARLISACEGKIVPVIAEELASRIENNFYTLENIREYVYDLLKPYRDAESVVLGCSHYSCIAPFIEKFYNGNIKIYDGATGAAERLKFCLAISGILNDGTMSGGLRFYDTVNFTK